jgi:CheY-like chemotaxis protein
MAVAASRMAGAERLVTYNYFTGFGWNPRIPPRDCGLVQTGPRILLVNDDEDGLFLLERTLAREFPQGSIQKARGAAEALSLLDHAEVDAIITDNRMPAMDGIEMVRLIRARDAKLPIFMLTGSEHLRASALAAGVTSFLASGNWDEIRVWMRATLQSVGGS